MNAKAMRALIVGGGVSGLAAGAALRLSGWDVLALERAAEIGEVGAGLQISPNGVKAMAALGMGEALAAIAHEPPRAEMRYGESGRRIFTMPLGDAARRRWGAPYCQAHRADLIDLLLRRFRELGGVLRTDAMVEAVETRGDCAAVRLLGGETLEADIVIGADGLRSTVREAICGAETPRYMGATAWRATAPTEALGQRRPPASACVWVGQGRHAVTYPLRNGALMNFVGVVDRPASEAMTEEAWTIEGARADALTDFSDYAPEVTEVIKAAPKIFQWPLFDRPPLARWSDGRMVLIGDACHPMAPSLAQGACQGLEDAVALAAELADNDDPKTAFTAFQTRRETRAARVQAGAAANLRLFHRCGGLSGEALYAVMRIANTAAPWVFPRKMDWLYEFDPTAGFSPAVSG